MVGFRAGEEAAKWDFGRRVTLDAEVAEREGSRVEVILPNDALDRLAGPDPRKPQPTELRYFGGLSLEETAEALGLTVAAVPGGAAR